MIHYLYKQSDLYYNFDDDFKCQSLYTVTITLLCGKKTIIKNVECYQLRGCLIDFTYIGVYRDKLTNIIKTFELSTIKSINFSFSIDNIKYLNDND